MPSTCRTPPFAAHEPGRALRRLSEGRTWALSLEILESPLSDSNRRPLPYHGRVGGLRASIDAHKRARSPCKRGKLGGRTLCPEYGRCGSDGRKMDGSLGPRVTRNYERWRTSRPSGGSGCLAVSRRRGCAAIARRSRREAVSAGHGKRPDSMRTCVRMLEYRYTVTEQNESF